jgi:IS30 family transposase
VGDDRTEPEVTGQGNGSRIEIEVLAGFEFDLAVRVIAAKLDDDWSPQQVAPQWLRREYLDDAAMRVSHELSYRDVYMPSRKVFDASMFHCLRSKRSIRRPPGKKSSHGRGQIRNIVSIHERPAEADTRQVTGHWE